MQQSTSEINGARREEREAEDYSNTYSRLQAQLLNRSGFDARSSSLSLKSIHTRVHILDGGGGDPVVMLHGGAGIGAEHIEVAALLSRRFRVIVPDRPGHGLSDPFDYLPCDLRQASVEFVGALLDELGLERAALVGNSFGGFMAVCFALAHPERVSKLIVLSFFPGMHRELPIMMRLMVAPIVGTVLGLTVGRPSLKNTRRFFSQLIVAHIERMPAELLELETLHSRRHQRSISSLFRAGLTLRGFRSRYVVADQLPQLKVPTAFVWGELDGFATVEEGRTAAGRVPGGSFVVIPDAGHLASCDQPQATAHLLERELQESPKLDVALAQRP